MLKELKEINAKIAAVIIRLETEHKTVVTTLAEGRRVAILEEIYRAGGTVTAKEVVYFAEKYGKKASSTAGYYSGKKPSLVTEQLSRNLTEAGKWIVAEKRKEWGDDWLERILMNIVSDEYTQDIEVVF